MPLPQSDPELLPPTRARSIVDGRLLSPMLAAACCLAAALTISPDDELAEGDTAHTLSCTLRALPAPGVGTELVLLNSSGQDLPAGTAWVWHDRGSPQGVAERRVLPHALASGQSLTLQTTRQAHGSGCGARWLAPELRPDVTALR